MTTKGDMYHKEILTKIIKEGFLDENPRPHYEDKVIVDGRTVTDMNGNIIVVKENQGLIKKNNQWYLCTPAHTYSINHVMVTYDLAKGETPMITLRPIAWKSAIKEILWIYQMQSNKLEDLHKMGIKYWDEWDIGDGTIGCRYGKTVDKRDLRNKLLNGLIEQPFGRRHILSLWQEDDFHDETGGTTKGLNPCCYETIWNIRKENGELYLDMLMNQRSSDFATSVTINEIQYVALQMMVAKHCGYKVGKFTHVLENVQIYDRHIDNAITLVERESIECAPHLELNTDKTNFDEFTIDDFVMVDYPIDKIKEKNPQLVFELGI